MTEQSQPNPYETGIRIEDDSDRTPEFIEKRTELIDTIDGFLDKILKMQMSGQVINNHAIKWQPVITETDLGPTGPNTKLRATEARDGVSLTGDGQSTRLSLQYVDGDKIIKLQGTDPLVKAVHGEAVPKRPNVIVASFYREEGRHYFGGEVQGFGAVAQRYFRESDGMNVGLAVRSTQDLEMLHAGLQSVLDEIIPAETLDRAV